MWFSVPQLPISLVPPFRPAVDGYFLPDLPEVLAARGEVTGHHLLTGATRDEGLIAGKGLTGTRGIGTQVKIRMRLAFMP